MSLIFEIWGNDGQYRFGVDDLPNTHKSWRDVWNETTVSRYNTAAVVFQSGWSGSNGGIQKELRLVDLETSSTLFSQTLTQNQFLLKSRSGDANYSIGTWSDDHKTFLLETYNYSLPPLSAAPTKASTLRIDCGVFGTQVSDNNGYQLVQYLNTDSKKYFIYQKWTNYGLDTSNVQIQDENGNNGRNDYYIKEVKTSGGKSTLVDFNAGVLPNYGSHIDWMQGLIYKGALYIQANTNLDNNSSDQHYYKYDLTAGAVGTSSVWSTITDHDFWNVEELVASYNSVIRDGENSYDLRALEPADTRMSINQSEDIPSGGKIIRYDANPPNNNIAGYEHWLVYKDGKITADHAFKSKELSIRSIQDTQDGYIYFNHVGVAIPESGALTGLTQNQSITVCRIAVSNVSTVLNKLNAANKGIQTISEVEQVGSFTRQSLNGGETPDAGNIAIIRGYIGDANGSIVISTVFDPSLDGDNQKSFVSRIENDGTLTHATRLADNAEVKDMVVDGALGYQLIYIDPRNNSYLKQVAYVDVRTGNLTYIDQSSVESLIGDYQDLFEYVKAVGRVPIGFSVVDLIISSATAHENRGWTEYLDDAGKVLYRSQTYDGHDRDGAEFSLVSIYDAKYALVESIYTDDSGYRLKTLYGSVDLVNDAGNVNGVKETADYIEYTRNEDGTYTQNKYWSESSSYDASGHLTLRSTFDGQMTTTYDASGAFISSQANIGGMDEVYKTYGDNDWNNNVIGYSYTVDEHYRYIYDEHSKLVARDYSTSDDQGQTTIHYDADWNITGGSFEAGENSQRISYEYTINKEINQNLSYKIVTEYQYANFTYSKSIYSYSANHVLQGYEKYDGIHITKYNANGVQTSTEIDTNRWIQFTDTDGIDKYKNKDTSDPYLTKLDLEGNFISKTKTWTNNWTDSYNGNSHSINITYYDQYGKQIGWENTYNSDKSNSYNKNLTYEVERKSADGNNSIFLKVTDNQYLNDRVDSDSTDNKNDSYTSSYSNREVAIYNSDHQYLGTASVRGGTWEFGDTPASSWSQASFNINTYEKVNLVGGGYKEISSYKQLASLTLTQIQYVNDLSYDLLSISPDTQSDSYSFYSYTNTFDSSGIQIGGGYEYDYVNLGVHNHYGYDYTYDQSSEGGVFNDGSDDGSLYDHSVSYHYDYYSWDSAGQKSTSSTSDATYFYSQNNQLVGYSTFDGLTTTTYDSHWTIIRQYAEREALDALVLAGKAASIIVEGVHYYDYDNGNHYVTRFDDEGILRFRIYKYVNGTELYQGDGTTPDPSNGYWSKYESIYDAQWVSIGGSYIDSNGWGYTYTNEKRVNDDGYSYYTHYQYRDGSTNDNENFYSASGAFVKAINYDGLITTEYDSTWHIVSQSADMNRIQYLLGDQVRLVGSENDHNIYEYRKNPSDNKITVLEDQLDGTADLVGYAYENSWNYQSSNSYEEYTYRTNYDSHWAQIGGSYQHTSTNSNTGETQTDGYTYTVERELNVTTYNDKDGGAYENISHYSFVNYDAAGQTTLTHYDSAEIYNSAGQYIGNRYTNDTYEVISKYENIQTKAVDGSYSVESKSSTNVHYFNDSSLDRIEWVKNVLQYDVNGNFIGASGSDCWGGNYSYTYSSDKISLVDDNGSYVGYEQSYEIDYAFGGNDYEYKYLYSSSGQFSGYENAYFNQVDHGTNSTYGANWLYYGSNDFKYDAGAKTLEITGYQDYESVYIGGLLHDQTLSGFHLNSSSISWDPDNTQSSDITVTLDNDGDWSNDGDQFKIILIGARDHVDLTLITSGHFLSL